MVTLQLLHKPSLHTLFSISSPQQPQQPQHPPSPPPSRRLSTISRASASPSHKKSSSSSSSCTASTTTGSRSRSRRQLIADTAAAAAATATLSFIGGGPKAFAEESLSEWERVYLPIDPGVVLLDIAFVPDDPSHGFLLGTRQTILETKDGGSRWVPRSIPSAEEEDFNYRFNSISFKGKEGWIVGKPSILLYTSDAGENWKRVPLSSQLPGDIHLRGSATGTIRKEERPRFFDSEAKRLCWAKAETAPGRHPERWRKDAAGNIVLKRFRSCQGCLCFEFDHIIPFSKGGQSVAENCQILQTRVNRFKSDKEDLKTNQLKGYSCDIHFSDSELDIIEMAVYGNVIRPGKECRCRTINEMVYIKTTGEKSAEMVTDEGAIYITANGGYNWRAAVQETVSATLNRTVSSGISGASYYTGTFSTVNRSPEGNYVAVSSRGNFYLTWEPGQPYWQPHNRNIARRIQSMGWRADGGLWLLVRGGGLYLSKGTGITEDFDEVPVQSRGFGILDVGYRSQDEAWAAGGSGILLKTTNSGKTWVRDKAADNIAANLYSVKFINDKQGFVLGNDGVLLKYLG